MFEHQFSVLANTLFQFFQYLEAVVQTCSVKNVLKSFSKFAVKQLCRSLFFNKVAGGACNFLKKKTLAQVFFAKFCEIIKNTFLYRTPLVAASEYYLTPSENLLVFHMISGDNEKELSLGKIKPFEIFRNNNKMNIKSKFKISLYPSR